MMKAKKGNDLIFGLTSENIEQLKKGQPIRFNLNELGLADQTVWIIYGESEQTFREMFAKEIDPTKTIIHDYKAKDN